MNLIIVEDDAGIRDTLHRYLERDTDHFELISSHESMEMLFQNAPDFTPNIVVLDINLPGISGIEGIGEVKKKWPEAEVVIVSALTDSESIFKAICSGASGYIDKEISLSKIKESLLSLKEGGSPITPSIARKVFDYFQPSNHVEEGLTDREKDIVRGIVDGLSYKLIADRLDISIDTVRKYIRRVYRKLEINSKGELIARYHKSRI
ncbi:response regulator transcription factor [bacterium SCSIO 12741]|nr:response regulator transcription factor [bacterium SCSIO 12741]